MINSFKDKHAFLSNFEVLYIVWASKDDITIPTLCTPDKVKAEREYNRIINCDSKGIDEVPKD